MVVKVRSIYLAWVCVSGYTAGLGYSCDFAPINMNWEIANIIRRIVGRISSICWKS